MHRLNQCCNWCTWRIRWQKDSDRYHLQDIKSDRYELQDINRDRYDSEDISKAIGTSYRISAKWRHFEMWLHLRLKGDIQLILQLFSSEVLSPVDQMEGRFKISYSMKCNLLQSITIHFFSTNTINWVRHDQMTNNSTTSGKIIWIIHLCCNNLPIYSG